MKTAFLTFVEIPKNRKDGTLFLQSRLQDQMAEPELAKCWPRTTMGRVMRAVILEAPDFEYVLVKLRSPRKQEGKNMPEDDGA